MALLFENPWRNVMVVLRLFQPHNARRMYVSGRPNTGSREGLSVSVIDLVPSELQSVIGMLSKSWIWAWKKVQVIVSDRGLTNSSKKNTRQKWNWSLNTCVNRMLWCCFFLFKKKKTPNENNMDGYWREGRKDGQPASMCFLMSHKSSTIFIVAMAERDESPLPTPTYLSPSHSHVYLPVIHALELRLLMPCLLYMTRLVPQRFI